MAQLTYNSMKLFRYIDDEFESNEAQYKEDTVRDNILRQIKSNHLKTDLSLEECRNHKDKFTLALKQRDVSHSLKGLLASEDFKQKCSHFEVRESLFACGLDEQETNMLLDSTEQRETESDGAFRMKLIDIQHRLESRQKRLESPEEASSAVVELNRHEFEEENRKFASASAEKLTHGLIRLRPHSDPTLHPDHPINSLKDLERELFPEGSPRRTQENKREQRLKRKRSSESDQISVKYFDTKPDSFWDMKDFPVLIQNESNIYKQVEPKRDNYTAATAKSAETRKDFSKPFVWPINESQLIPQSIINQNKLTLEDIKKDPKFAYYDPGIPSSTLYVKNLSHPCSPLSLVSLFAHLEKENISQIEYRILKGKMKGQAFISFSSVQVAMKAFSLCCGYVLNGKPLVLEYSRKC